MFWGFGNKESAPASEEAEEFKTEKTTWKQEASIGKKITLAATMLISSFASGQRSGEVEAETVTYKTEYNVPGVFENVKKCREETLENTRKIFGGLDDVSAPTSSQLVENITGIKAPDDPIGLTKIKWAKEQLDSLFGKYSDWIVNESTQGLLNSIPVYPVSPENKNVALSAGGIDKQSGKIVRLESGDFILIGYVGNGMTGSVNKGEFGMVGLDIEYSTDDGKRTINAYELKNINLNTTNTEKLK